MSLRFLSAVAENPHFTASEKLLLLCLADHADEQGLSWPSIPRIEHWTSLDRKTIFSTLSRLETAGCVGRDRKHGQVNKYRLDVVALQSYPSTDFTTSTKNGTSTKDGTTTSTKNGTRVVPKTVPRTIIEPSLEPDKEGAADAAVSEKPLEKVYPNTLTEWQGLVSEATNKVAVLVDMAQHHWGKPLEKDAGGRAAALLKEARDPMLAAKILWDAIGGDPGGDLFRFAIGKARFIRNGAKPPNLHEMRRELERGASKGRAVVTK